jgi:hypothetical protein
MGGNGYDKKSYLTPCVWRDNDGQVYTTRHKLWGILAFFIEKHHPRHDGQQLSIMTPTENDHGEFAVNRS